MTHPEPYILLIAYQEGAWLVLDMRPERDDDLALDDWGYVVERAHPDTPDGLYRIEVPTDADEPCRVTRAGDLPTLEAKHG